AFLLPLSQIPTNALTFASVLAVLAVAQPLTALIAFLYLAAIALFMLFAITRRSRIAGQHHRRYSYFTSRIMSEMVEALKEVTLRNKLDGAGRVVTQNRRRSTRARANLSFLGAVPKYAYEAALIGGFLLIGGISYLTSGPV